MEKIQHRAARELLRVLAPVVECTAQVRPRLVLLLPLATGGALLFGVVAHTAKQSIQARLRLYYPTGHSELLRATRWTPLSAEEAFARYAAQVRESFAALAAGLGGEMVALEFGPAATEEEIGAALLASRIATILRPLLN